LFVVRHHRPSKVTRIISNYLQQFHDHRHISVSRDSDSLKNAGGDLRCLRRVLREPLLHFFRIGAAQFVLKAVIAPAIAQE